ncbi:uncharacterized protein LOC119179883 isoform X2 [Rhipicephalus microplus]|uniref:uncharacterized protein LOC119179883 isoform X2 n=1 Tax=Rhipicephalus microplus TaxID=6941 RepID=UPI003F6A9548
MIAGYLAVSLKQALCHRSHTITKVALLLNPQHLIISRAIYTNHDYPLCVRSRLKKFVEVGYNHNVSYFERGYQNETHGRRYYRNAFYYVQHVGQVLLFVASAFTERHHVDPLVSGSYKVLYANPVCFVAATNPRSGKEACLLWRLARPRQHERYSCRAAFNIYCSSYTGHRVFYTRELCATRNAIRRPNGVLQSLGKGPE